MAWTRGQLITADAIKSYNSGARDVIAYGHQGWSWRYLYLYFWNGRISGETMMNYTSARTAGCKHSLTLHRLENGGWVSKGKWEGSTTQLNGNYDSRGPGIYYIYFWDHNNAPTFTLYPGSYTNIYRGRPLAMIDRGPTRMSEAEAKALNWRCHNQITAYDLNQCRVYTL